MHRAAKHTEKPKPRPHAALVALTALLGLLVFGSSACRKQPTAAAADNGLQPGHYPPNTEQAADTKFIRFIDLGDGDGRLETAIATYEGERGEKVELVSAVHIADAAYYARLEKLFATYESLLYELIKADGEEPPEPGRRKIGASGVNMIALFQRAMRDGLELDYQIEAIDYSAENFVHADLDAETFLRLSKERGQTLTKLMLQSMLQEFVKMLKGEGTTQIDPLLEVKMLSALFSRDRAKRLKYLFAQQMQHIDEMMEGFGGEDSVILTERNKQAIEVLRERLAGGEKNIGVFYGGAHLPDLEERIFKEIGLRRTGVRWESAWVIK